MGKLDPACQSAVKDGWIALMEKDVTAARELVADCMKINDPVCAHINRESLPLFIDRSPDDAVTHVMDCVEAQNKECLPTVVRESRNLVAKGVLENYGSLKFAGKTDEVSQAILKNGFEWLSENDKEDIWPGRSWAQWCIAKQDPACRSIIERSVARVITEKDIFFLRMCIKNIDPPCLDLARKSSLKLVNEAQELFLRNG